MTISKDTNLPTSKSCRVIGTQTGARALKSPLFLYLAPDAILRRLRYAPLTSSSHPS